MLKHIIWHNLCSVIYRVSFRKRTNSNIQQTYVKIISMANKTSKILRIILIGALIVIAIIIAVFATIGLPESLKSSSLISEYISPEKKSESSPNENTITSQPEEKTEKVVPEIGDEQIATFQYDISDGIILLSLADGYYKHLFAFHPESIPLSRITNTQGDDINPEFSPDGNYIAYASNRNGQWDIFILDIKRGNEIQLTDSLEYDGSPTWSPDGQWIAYESYVNYNLEIFLLSTIDRDQSPVQLTNNQDSDHSPKWSPLTSKIVFVSDRSGNNEIWLVEIGDTENRFTNISNNPNEQDLFPAWSHDGQYIAWSSVYERNRSIFYIDTNSDDYKTKRAGTGNRPLWSPDDNAILSEINFPNSNGLTIYSSDDGQILLPLTYLQSKTFGIDWKSGEVSSGLIKYIIEHNEHYVLPKLWENKDIDNTVSAIGREKLAQLPDTSAPYPFLHNDVDDSFLNLRTYVSEIVGWDFLQNLENAYIPITEPLKPGMENDWLLTGRAFAFNILPLDAGWVKIIREDVFGETYWRVYLKTRYQDGTQGQPLRYTPWDMSARYEGDTISYEQGGKLESVPSGYWIDFTEIASRFGWKRLPAQNDWRTYFPSTRFNHYVFVEGSNWYDALLEIYPEEIIGDQN